MQHLEELQPKMQIDIDTKVLTRNYLDRVYETVSINNQVDDELKPEFERVEKPVGVEIAKSMIQHV